MIPSSMSNATTTKASIHWSYFPPFIPVSIIMSFLYLKGKNNIILTIKNLYRKKVKIDLSDEKCSYAR